MKLRARVAVLFLLMACESSEDAGGGAGTDAGSGAVVETTRDGGDRGEPTTQTPPDARAPDTRGDAAMSPSVRGDASTPALDGGAGRTTDAGVDLSAELYDPTKLPRFDLELPQASVASLNMVANAEDPRQDDYVTGTLKYGGETVANIGVRIKGEGSFQKLDKKPAFKLKFDEYVKNQAFRGLRRMTFNNAYEDPSFVAERLAYDLFRAAGLPAPRCNNALLYINGTFYGVYVNVEAEDKTFLRRWFASDDGNLYEEGGEDFVPEAETRFSLETNETANDRSDLIALIDEVQGATDPATFLDRLTHLNTAQFLKFTAAEAAVNQWDMYGYTVFYVNNMRIYDDPATNKFVFLPWGMDMSMKPFRDTRKPYIRLFALARQYDRSNGEVTAGLIFQRCLKSPSCKAEYVKAVQEVIRVYESAGMEARANAYYAQIKERVLEDKRKNQCCDSAPLLNEEFEDGYQSVLMTIRGRVAALRADLDAN